jgi:hypothetical protein
VQVTFVAEEIPPLEYLHQVELWGTMYNLYSYSFETLGLVRILSPLIGMLQFFTINNRRTCFAFVLLHSNILTWGSMLLRVLSNTFLRYHNYKVAFLWFLERSSFNKGFACVGDGVKELVEVPACKYSPFMYVIN